MDRKQSLRRMKEQEKIIEIQERDNLINHHGVKGMKWGIRRYQPYTDSNMRKGGKKGIFKDKKSTKAANTTVSNIKNVDKIKGRQNLTITDKKGNTSTYSMDADAAKKFAKKANSEGMKWKSESAKKDKGKGIVKTAKETVERKAKSAIRELDAGRLQKSDKLKSMSDSQIKEVTSRLRNENDLKRLSKTKDDKIKYENRANMSTEELTKTVQRLQIEDNLRQQSKAATAQQREFAERVFEGAVDSVLSEYSKGVTPTVTSALQGALEGATPKTLPGKYDNKISEAHEQRIKAITKELEKS